MELHIVGRFHAREGCEEAVADAIRDVRGPTQAEPGCLEYQALRSASDSRLFWIYSRWGTETEFDRHAELPHTVRFLEDVTPLIDHELQVSRSRLLD